MTHIMSKSSYIRPLILLTSGASLILLGTTGWLYYERAQQKAKIETLQLDRNYFLLENASTTERLQAEAETASTTIATLTRERDELMEKLAREQDKNSDFERQISRISNTVGRLDKLSKTDEELLQKYSKVYFLSEHYVPSRLKTIDSKHLAPGRQEQYFHADALPFLNRLLTAAEDDGITITVVSAYRSFETQAELKGAYTQTYGSGANTFSADQGYSEHQLGTAIDFSTPDLGGTLGGFGDSEAYAWLKENAHKYGFILSYPQGNSYYVYEPWHWRFVGQDLAADLKAGGANFYDWDQRKIDEYLIEIFE